MDITVIAIIFGIIVALVHFSSDKIHKYKRYKNEIMSLAAGISLAYLLLFLLPELYRGVETIQKLLFVFVLIGALSFHLVEKYIYQHSKKNKIIEEISVFHSLSFFVYHFVIGVVLVNLLQTNILTGTLFLLPILSYIAVGQVSLKEIHAKVTEKLAVKVLLSFSTLIGIIEAIFLPLPTKVFYSLLGFIGGAMLYHVMRENIPAENGGDGLWFLLGAFLYTLLIMFIWSI